MAGMLHVIEIQVINTEAVTKSDFSLTSRDQPPIAIGIYAHRVIRKRYWLLWSSCETQYLVSGYVNSTHA